jgi:hypothetical protein
VDFRIFLAQEKTDDEVVFDASRTDIGSCESEDRGTDWDVIDSGRAGIEGCKVGGSAARELGSISQKHLGSRCIHRPLHSTRGWSRSSAFMLDMEPAML